jgi:hypothetical protein
MKSKIFNLLLVLVVLSSCSKELEVDTPFFEVSTESTTYQVGEEITFTFEGNPKQIWFYSGELLNDYDYKDGRIVDISSGDGATVSFSSAVVDGTQANQLTVLYSKNFNGTYDYTNVKAAEWVDITNNFTFGTGSSFVASGSYDVSDFLSAGEPVYFAFRYITRPQATNGVARKWNIQNFTIISKATLEDGSALTIADQTYAGFRLVDENAENAPAQSVITSTRISLLGNVYKNPDDPIYDPENPIYDPESDEYDPSAVLPVYDPNNPYNDPLSENWAVSKPIYTDEVDLGPDLSIAIKEYYTQVMSYAYSYSEAGVFDVYFVAANTSVDDSKQVVKHLEITITE